MEWTKIVLLFQAIVTLAIGLVFFSQLVVIDNSEVVDSIVESSQEENFSISIDSTLNDIKHRYTIATYILFTVSLIEIILISRLLR